MCRLAQELSLTLKLRFVWPKLIAFFSIKSSTFGATKVNFSYFDSRILLGIKALDCCCSPVEMRDKARLERDTTRLEPTRIHDVNKRADVSASPELELSSNTNMNPNPNLNLSSAQLELGSDLELNLGMAMKN